MRNEYIDNCIWKEEDTMTSTGVSNTLLMTAMAGNVEQGNVKDTGGKNFD